MYNYVFVWGIIKITIPATNYDDAYKALEIKLEIIKGMGVEMPYATDFLLETCY